MGTEGLNELFMAHRRKLDALARGIVGDREDAADVVADAFVAFLERGPRHPDDAGAWLYVVTRNKARNRVRDRLRADRRPRPTLEPVVDARPVDERVVELLGRAAAALPARDARAIEFRFRHGLEYAEIGSALGISAATARVLVHRASRRLRGQTVGLLADHHGASASCRRALLHDAVRGRVRSHDGCASCSAVAEEVYALAVRGAFVLPIPMRDRLIDNPLNRWLATRMPGRAMTSPAHVLEAVTAVIASGAVLTSGARVPLPTAAAPPPHGAHVVSIPAPIAAIASNIDLTSATGIAHLAAPMSHADVDLDLPARDVQVFEDRGDDAEEVTADVFELPRLLGVPLVVPGRRANSGPDSADLRTLHIGTTAGEEGGATGLYFRLGLAAVPDGLASYNVSFRIGDTPCSWSVWIYPEMTSDNAFTGTFDTSLSETCSPRSSEEAGSSDAGLSRSVLDYGPYADDLAQEFSDGFRTGWERGYSDSKTAFPAVLSGRGVALEIPFSSLNPRHREHLQSAEWLRQVEVSASFDLSQDRLPDEGTIDYRLERGV